MHTHTHMTSTAAKLQRSAGRNFCRQKRCGMSSWARWPLVRCVTTLATDTLP
jgi:hypothetical protein